MDGLNYKILTISFFRVGNFNIFLDNTSHCISIYKLNEP